MNDGLAPPDHSIRIGIDIGGTFTDFVVYDPQDGSIKTFKILSTPHNPAEAVLHGLELVIKSLKKSDFGDLIDIVHGSTVATNALLERRGARTAFIATRGFKDILQIGRQNRGALYDFFADTPAPLVPDGLRFELDERVDHRGQAIQTLAHEQVALLVPILRDRQVESIAVCLLFSFLYPNHEQEIAAILRSAGFFVSPSHEILPEFREYERASTTAVNAYVSPILDLYLSTLESAIKRIDQSVQLGVIQSNGGIISIDAARRNGVHCILSGPAGGVIGCRHVGLQAMSQSVHSLDLLGRNDEQKLRLITFDMGGTSTDVSLIDGAPQVTTESIVGGSPIRIPVLDIHTIGAGGGSIARVDGGGALRVGPESAGADPGPACYGKGDLPTVTDANLILGRLASDFFLGGQMHLDFERAYSAFNRLGMMLDLDPVQTALGVVEVANAHMEHALRVISVERGYDPRRFTLLSFGGAGGLHAADLARRLGIRHILAPPLASTLSAFGMLAADIVKDYSLTIMQPGDTPLDTVGLQFTQLVEQGQSELQSAAHNTPGSIPQPIEIERFADLRYLGQSYELTVPFSKSVVADFHEMHKAIYGYARPGAEVEFVNLRVRAIQRVSPPALQTKRLAGTIPSQALLGSRQVLIRSRIGPEQTPFYRGEELLPGNRFIGPAVFVRNDTTILLGASDKAEVDVFGNLWIQVGE